MQGSNQGNANAAVAAAPIGAASGISREVGRVAVYMASV